MTKKHKQLILKRRPQMIVYKIFGNQRTRVIHSLKKVYRKGEDWKKLRAQIMIAGFPHTPKLRANK